MADIYSRDHLQTGHVISREIHNGTLYVSWAGRTERLRGEAAQALWHLPNGTTFDVKCDLAVRPGRRRGTYTCAVRLEKVYTEEELKEIDDFIHNTLLPRRVTTPS